MSNHVKHKIYLKPEPVVVHLHIRYELTHKGENTTKLIIPVSHIPFSSFDELVLSNYAVLSGLLWKRNRTIFASYMRNLSEILRKRGEKINNGGFHQFEIIDREDMRRDYFRFKMRSKLYKYAREGLSRLSKAQELILNNTRLDLYYLPEYWKHLRWIAVTGLAHLFNCSNNPKVAVVVEKTRVLKFQSLHTSNSYKAQRKVYPLSFGTIPLATVVKGT